MSIAGWTSLPSPLHQSINQSNTPLILEDGGILVPHHHRVCRVYDLASNFYLGPIVTSSPPLRRVEIRSWISRERKDVLHTRTARDARGGGERATRGRRGTGKGRGAPRARSGPKASSQKSIVGSAPQRAPSAGVKVPGRVLGCDWETYKTFTSRTRRRTRIDKTRAGRVCRVPYESSSLRVKLGSS